MGGNSNRWALILAAGSGTRLSSLTRFNDGIAVPKQFCSLTGGRSLLEETLERAHSIAAPAQTVVVVAAEQRQYWEGTLNVVPRDNVVIQPRNRGTANGILLGTATVMEREPDAKLLVLPSDHFVEQEYVLRRSILRAIESLAPQSRDIKFLGVKPESPDPELGYIVRGCREADGSYGIAEFVEKPTYENALALLDRSALWNSFILVACARALVDVIARRYPDEVAALLQAIRDGGQSVQRLYERLPDIDFSRHVIEGAEAPLKVVPVSRCGWSDLGTPKRVAECLSRLGHLTLPAQNAQWSLAEGHSRLRELSGAAVQCA